MSASRQVIPPRRVQVGQWVVGRSAGIDRRIVAARGDDGCARSAPRRQAGTDRLARHLFVQSVDAEDKPTPTLHCGRRRGVPELVELHGQLPLLSYTAGPPEN